MDENTKPIRSKGEKIATIIGIIFCVLLIPILIFNVVTIFDSIINKDEVPGFFNLTPMVVTSGSMEPIIMTGDLIISVDVDTDDLVNEDIITYYVPRKDGTKEVITHQIVDIKDDGDGTRTFVTKGTNDSAAEADIPEENVIGKYWIRIPLIGDLLIFMESGIGIVVCVGIPLLLLIGYELIRRFVYEKGNKKDMDDMRAELEALRAEKEKLESEKQAGENEIPPSEE